MAKTIFDMFIFFSLGLWSGVFAGDAVKSVTEGESVTLEIDVNTDDQIQWRFGHILIALVNRQSGKIKVFDNVLDGRFRGRLELDKTGSLTITDTRTTDSGLYKPQISSSTQTHLNAFNLTVYARLSVPVISRSSQNSSSSEQSCSLLCSAVNVSDVSVSWYRGHSLLSSISASDLSISLSLRLEIECPYDSYSCVLNNSISNQTTHLNTQLCKTCAGVFAGDAVKSVSVTEGESVTLEIDDTTDDEIQWIFGHSKILIAQINRQSGKIQVFDNVLDGRFRDRLELDHKTGSLTITDTRTTDSGLYEVKISSSTQTHLNTFNLTVYARLSVPVISRSSQNASSSEQSCSLLCSAVNVSDVSVSWYRGHSLLSSISASDLSISLSLRLEIECLDNNTYSCVINNSFTNQTTHLDISTLCQPCAVSVSLIVLVSAAAGSLLIVAAVRIFCICRKRDQEVESGEEITYADPTFYKRKAQKSSVQEQEDVVYAGVAIRH